MSESFLDKFVGLQACGFIKKRLQHRCFPVNIVKFLRTPILKNTCERLFLQIPERSYSKRVLLYLLNQMPWLWRVVTWASWFSGHRFKLEAKDFIFHNSPEKFSKFGPEKTCFVFSKKSSEFLLWLILFSVGIYLLKVWLKHSQNRKFFFFFYSQVAYTYNCSN